MEKYVYTLGLIPVQEWIAQARRSRDLRAGSVFLWHTLARLLARVEQKPGEVWLPVPPGESFAELAALSFSQAFEEPYGIPHRASGFLMVSGAEEVRQLFLELQGQLLADWQAFRAADLSRRSKDSAAFWREVEPWWRQYQEKTAQGEDCPVHLIWVARPAPFPVEARGPNLAAIDRLYSDVKRSRPLRPGPPGSAAGKCNQCGQREAVGPGDTFENWRKFYRGLERDPWIQEGFLLDLGERLCFVCLAKRVAGYDEENRRKFPSTGEIAAASWLERLRKEGGELRCLADKLEHSQLGRQDFGRALYASKVELDRIGLEENQRTEILGLRAQIGKALEQRRRQKRKPGETSPPKPEPSPYLALLTFDGDDMGRTIQENPGLAPTLAQFAREAGELLEAHQGRAFYLAGDEGLLMVPAENALGLAFALRDAFRRIVAADADLPSLSAGIAWFEHSRPMRGAIQAARAALQEAKELRTTGDSPAKDGLGVTVQTASGSRWGFAAHWKGGDWQRVRSAVRLIQEGKLSPSWAYDAERFLETIPDGDWNDAGVVAAAREEVRRLFLRRLHLSSPKTDEERLAAERAEWVALPGRTWWQREADGRFAKAKPEQFHLIGFLARQATVLPAGDEA